MNVLTRFGSTALCSLAVIYVGRAQSAPTASDAQAQAAIKYRQALFELQKYAYLPMDAFLKGAPFNAAAAQTAAERLEMTSTMIPELFKIDTRKTHGTTRALDGIWTNTAVFQQKAHDLHQAAVNLEMAAKSGDADATHRAAIAVGKACGACHDEFRSQ